MLLRERPASTLIVADSVIPLLAASNPNYDNSKITDINSISSYKVGLLPLNIECYHKGV